MGFKCDAQAKVVDKITSKGSNPATIVKMCVCVCVCVCIMCICT